MALVILNEIILLQQRNVFGKLIFKKSKTLYNLSYRTTQE